MDGEAIVESLLRGALGGRGKRWRGTRRAVGRRGSLINATTLLAAAGVAWGVYETWQHQTASGAPGSTAGSAGTPPPPIPAGGTQAAVPPPLSPTAAAELPEGVLRVVRLMISAASADGHLGPEERQKILEEARKVGAESAVAREMESPRPLPEIVAGVSDPKLKQDLYTLAFAIVRADETVTGGERIYLAQLAHRLDLDAATVERIEGEAAAHIDEAGALPPGAPIE
jgi:uncharacterized membrane protein YebE (DUF533 family)